MDCRDLAYILAGEGPSLLNRDTMYCKKKLVCSSRFIAACFKLPTQARREEKRAQPTPTLPYICTAIDSFIFTWTMMSEKSQDLPVFTKVQFSNFNVVIDVNELFSYFENLIFKVSPAFSFIQKSSLVAF